jgi:arabinogalactan oligomer/maltooligosaccharide transport system substrate-binding protein
MINKKIAVGILALASMGLAACGGSTTSNGSGDSGSAGEIAYDSESEMDYSYTGAESISYWCPTTDTAFMEAQVAAFKAANKGFTGTISLLASVGEGDVKTELLKDPEAAADVMCIADDNISPAVTGRALTAIGKTTDSTTKGSVIRKILAHQGSAALSAVSVGTNVYGYPYRNDNGYCLIYDKRIVSDTAAASMEGILAACKTGNATFNYDLGTAWYGASYLWANGCTTSTDTDGKFHASFANDNGVAAALAAQALYTTYGGTNWLFSTDTTKFGVEGTGRVGAVVLWNNYDALKTAVGEANIGVAALPTIKIGDSNKALKSFMGFKAMSIRKAEALTAEKLKLSEAFCSFVTSKDSQKTRLTTLSQGVSDKSLASDAAFNALPFLKALTSMAAAGNTVSQANGACGNFWDPMATFNGYIKAGTLTKDNVLGYLQTMVTAMEKVD